MPVRVLVYALVWLAAVTTTDKPWSHYRGRVAALTRSRSSTDPDLLEARRDLRAARLEDFIRRTVDAAPPLTDEQRDRLALILRGGGDG